MVPPTLAFLILNIVEVKTYSAVSVFFSILREGQYNFFLSLLRVEKQTFIGPTGGNCNFVNITVYFLRTNNYWPVSSHGWARQKQGLPPFNEEQEKSNTSRQKAE